MTTRRGSLNTIRLRRSSHAIWFLLLLAGTATAAERDICENRTGQDLIRCIEASARGVPPAPSVVAPAPRPPAQPSASDRAPQSAKTVTLPAAPVTTIAEPPPFPPQDCTGRIDNDLRTCLAAGGRLQPSAAVVPSAPPKPAPTPASPAAESCDGKTGEALRACIEQSARSPAKAVTRPLPCTGYTAADQPLCVHRNTAIIECENRKRYPDFDVCMRSLMVRAPEPKTADCRNVPPRAKGHCESRNRVYQSCTGDKIGYFACLERHLGTDAILTRR